MSEKILSSCLITKLPIIQQFNLGQSGYDYKIKAGEYEHVITLPDDFEKDHYQFLDQYDYLLKGFLYNGIWLPSLKKGDKESLTELIANTYYPKTPQEKLDNLFEYIYKMQAYDGEVIEFRNTTFLNDDGEWNKLYFKKIEELIFYINQLHTQGLAEVSNNSLSFPFDISLTLEGLKYANKIIEGKESNICFVAMSFDESLNYIYTDAIQKAIVETGFTPLIIKNEHLDSDMTINDGILAGIKKAKFMIADFTQNKRGVYFEAGYALGRGQKVIYTCKDEPTEVKELHFDTNHYQHILWKDAEDLKQKLIDKIEVFIKP